MVDIRSSNCPLTPMWDWGTMFLSHPIGPSLSLLSPWRSERMPPGVESPYCACSVLTFCSVFSYFSLIPCVACSLEVPCLFGEKSGEGIIIYKAPELNSHEEKNSLKCWKPGQRPGGLGSLCGPIPSGPWSCIWHKDQTWAAASVYKYGWSSVLFPFFLIKWK